MGTDGEESIVWMNTVDDSSWTLSLVEAVYGNDTYFSDGNINVELNPG